MLSEEEIENAKGWLSALDIKSEFEAISKEIISQYIEQLENQIEAKEMEHKYDVNMIDEVKRETVKLYKEIRQLEQENKALKKGQASLMSSRKKWKYRYYKLRRMFKKQNKIIDEMADIIKDYDIDYSDICKYRFVRHCEKAPTGCKECVKQYFEKKVEGK